MSSRLRKFQDPNLTSKGQKRASVAFGHLDTLWINSGSRCNLECNHCYMESGPRNDSLSFLDVNDLVPIFEEIDSGNMVPRYIGITGGEPFLNPHIIRIMQEILDRGHKILLLTNGTKVLEQHKADLEKLETYYHRKVDIRVSLDGPTQSIHQSHRGTGVWSTVLDNIRWLAERGFKISIAGRRFDIQEEMELLDSFKKLFAEQKIGIKLELGENILFFPEMSSHQEVPEISVGCWAILKKDPSQMMCSNSRMVIKRKGEPRAKLVACTLLPYDQRFELSHTLADSLSEVPLNHPYCAQFCVLGGSSCN